MGVVVAHAHRAAHDDQPVVRRKRARVAVARERAHDLELRAGAAQRVGEDAGMLEWMVLQDEDAGRAHGALSPRVACGRKVRAGSRRVNVV